MSLTFVENQALKTYYQYYTEFLSAEGKLKEATRLEEKQKQSASKKMGRLIEKVSLPFKYQKMPFNFILNDYIIFNSCDHKKQHHCFFFCHAHGQHFPPVHCKVQQGCSAHDCHFLDYHFWLLWLPFVFVRATVCFSCYSNFWGNLYSILCAQRQCKVEEIQLKCTKARNDYLLNLSAANACMNKYYLHDLPTLIDVSPYAPKETAYTMGFPN